MSVLIAALLVPLFIDWTGYRGQFEREASKILGRTVKVAGHASVRILPFPSVGFSDVRVGDDIENPALTIEKFSMDLELAPFLSGEVLIFDMRLTRPHAVIVVNKDGTIDGLPQFKSPVELGDVRIENLVVEDGLIELIDRGSGATRTLAFGKAVVSAKALTGPWNVRTVGKFDGEETHISLSTGQVDKGILPLRITALPLKRSVILTSDGSVKLDAGRLSYGGQFNLRPAIKSDYEAVQLRGPARAGGLSVPAAFKIAGKFGLASTGLALPEFSLETGTMEKPYSADGSGSIIFGAAPMFDVKLVGQQVNFDDNDDAQAEGAGFDKRISSLRQFFVTLPMPNMAGTIDVNLPAIVAGDTTIRDIAFSATPDNGAWRVRDLKATLPGRTKLEADGLLTLSEDFGFRGKLLVASTQPAGLADWLLGHIDPNLRKLGAVGFSANVDLRPDTQIFDKLELGLGGAVFTGAAERRSNGQRPQLNLALTGGALELDGLVPIGFSDQQGQTAVAGHDVNLTLDAGPVSHHGAVAEKLGLSLRMKADTIDIDRLMVSDLAGVSVSATGKIADLSTSATSTIDASIMSTDASAFVAMLAQEFPNSPFLQTLSDRVTDVPDLLSDMNATLIATSALDGKDRSLTISLNAKTGTGGLVLAGNGKGPDLLNAAMSFQGSAEQDDPLNFVALAGVPIIPLGAPGPARIEFSAQGDLTNGLDTKITYVADETSAAYRGQISANANGPRLYGAFDLQSTDFDPYLNASGLVYSGVGTGTPIALKSLFSAESGRLTLNSLEGSIADTKISGDLNFAMSERPALTGSVKVSVLDMVWLLENLYGASAFDALSTTSSATPFATQPVSPFDGNLAFQADELTFGPIEAAKSASGSLGFSENGVRVENLSASLRGGTVSGTFDMRNNGGEGSVTADFSLKGASASEFGFLTAISGGIDFGGSVTASGKTIEGLIAGLTGSGIAHIRQGVLSGFNPHAFPSILAAYANSSKAPSLNEVEATIASSVLDGSIPLHSDPMTWSVGAGKLRMAGISGSQGGAMLSADTSVDLLEFTASAAGSIRYEPGKESVVGAEPVVPFVATVDANGASLSTDPQPLLQYLTQGALEREQARVEALQAALVEKQRLRRDARLIAMLYTERDRRAVLREAAIRKNAAQRGAELAAQWKIEEARLNTERQEREAQQERAALEAEEAAEKAKLQESLFLNRPPVSQDGTLDGVFKSLDLQSNPN